jgi:hypothetical protein
MRTLPIQDVLGHAWRSTASNLRFAWHISWPWLAVIVPLQIIIEPNLPRVVPESTDPATIASNMKALAGLLFLGLVSILAFSSIAVAWHRYVLKDEVPNGLARFRLDSVVWRYFGNTLLIILLVCLAVIPIAVVLSILAALLGVSEVAATILIAVVAALLGLPLVYRMMVKLPAIALGNSDISLKTAIEKTEGNSFQLGIAGFIILAVVFLIGTVMQQVLSMLGLVTADQTSVVAIFIQQMGNWITTIFTVTFLTSLYGFFVEGRDF